MFCGLPFLGACGWVDGPVDQASSRCGTGTWRAGWLEIHQLALGQADAALIVSPSGKTLLFDAGEVTWDRDAGAATIGAALRRVLGCTRIDHVVISHFHVDHVGYPGRGGLWHLVEVQGLRVGDTWHRDLFSMAGETSSTLRLWRAELSGPRRERYRARVATVGEGQVDLGPGVSFRIVALDGAGALRRGRFDGDPHPPSENDLSIVAVLRFGRLDVFFGGDLSGAFVAGGGKARPHDIERAVAPLVGDMDVYMVNHHGSERSSGAAFLAQLDPEVAILSVGARNPHGHPHPRAVARLQATSTLFSTAKGDVFLGTTDGIHYIVNGTSFLATDPQRIDRDGDGYYREADPNDEDSRVLPLANGPCDSIYEAEPSCAVSRAP